MRIIVGTYLDAVVTVSEVLHGLELLVDDTNACLVRPVDDALDVLCSLSHCLQLLVETLCGFDGGLGVEFSYT
jgi:hypothetical protein